ncbi:hypothetical protein ACJ5H2_05920 [Nocardioides sp. R1-1]|uniref:hypothetical protein n=1 Tax=Nocardioides sp. R1-1 TaxID=3383502 RepID=UPI0038CFB470
MTLKASAEGADRLATTIGQAAAALLDLAPVNEEAASDVLGFVDPPVRTGLLASTVREEHDALGFTLTAGSQAARYAPFVHAQDPFLTEALEQRQEAVVEHYVDHVRDAVDLIQGD